MTEYAYYSVNVGPGPDGPVWRYPEGQEQGVYLRSDSVEPAVLRRDNLAKYKGYRQLAESEVPAWAKPSVFEYAPDRLLRGRTQGSRSLVEGEFLQMSRNGNVVVEVTKILEDRRTGLGMISLHEGLSTVLDPDTVEAVVPGEVNVKVALDTSAFEAAAQQAFLNPDLSDNFYVPDTPRASVLAEASELVHGERNANYGTPTENFERTAALWNAQLGHKLVEGQAFTPQDVAMLMVQLKMARLVTSPGKRDHYVDAAGYLACGWECQGA